MKLCRAREAGTQEQRPVLKPRKAVPHYVHTAGVILGRGKILLAKRPAKGLLAGMWEFPNGRVSGDPAKGLVGALKTGYGLTVRRKEALCVVQHAYTHFKVTVHAFRCEASSIPRQNDLKWVRITELEEFPMGKIDRQIARVLTDV
jgi:A/G-specific adenine glycosylase